MLGSMLDSTKSGILKYIILMFIVLGAGGLVMTDVGGFFTGGQIGRDVVATVGGKDITAQHFDRGYRQSMYRNGSTPQEGILNGEAQKYLDSLIMQALLYQMGEDNGLEIPRDALLEDIKQIIAAYNIEDMSDAEAFQLFLRNNGLNEEAFLNQLRQEKIVQMMATILTGITVLPEGLGRDYAQVLNHGRRLSALVIDPAKIDYDESAITEAELRVYYDVTKYLYNTDQLRSIDVLRLDKDMVTEKIDVSEDAMREYYELNLDLFTTPEQRTLEQILIRDEAKAMQALALIRDENLTIKQAAARIDEASAYRAPSDFSMNGLAEELRLPIFDGETGNVIGPIKTALGWHVVRINNILSEQTQPFEEAQDSLKDIVTQEIITDELYQLSLDIEEAADSGVGASDIAAEFGLPLDSFTNVASNETLDTDNANLILSNAFTLNAYETSGLIEAENDSYLIVTVTDIVESNPRPFEDVKSQVEADYIASQRRQKAIGMAEQARIAIEQGETDFATLGKDKGVKYDVLRGFKRFDQPALYLSDTNIAEIFDAKVDDILLFDDQSRIVVARVDTLQILDQFDLTDSLINAQGSLLNQLISDSSFEALVSALYERYDVKINYEAIQAMYIFDNQ